MGLNIGAYVEMSVCNLESVFTKEAPFEHSFSLDTTLYLRNKYEREEDVVKRGSAQKETTRKGRYSWNLD
ncbi:MAG: hypothetical protein ACLQGU_16450 [bacterium]